MMVREGQYLERATVIAGTAGPLEGLHHRGPHPVPVLIAPSRPDAGGSMEVAIIAELAWALTRRGHGTLRFNYRGVGASRGPFDEMGAVDDLRAAEAHLRDGMTDGHAPIGMVGLGFGANLVLDRACQEGLPVEAVVAVAPEAAVPIEDLDVWAREWVVVHAQEDPEGEGPHAEAIAQSRHGRRVRVAGADPRFFRGLVELGRVVAETFSPPGMLWNDG